MKHLVLTMTIFFSSISFAKEEGPTLMDPEPKGPNEVVTFTLSVKDRLGELRLTETMPTEETRPVFQNRTVRVESKCAGEREWKVRLMAPACAFLEYAHTKNSVWNPKTKEIAVHFSQQAILKGGALVCAKDWTTYVNLKAFCPQ